MLRSASVLKHKKKKRKHGTKRALELDIHLLAGDTRQRLPEYYSRLVPVQRRISRRDSCSFLPYRAAGDQMRDAVQSTC